MNLVSIIIPTFNGEKTIQRSLDSVLKQTYSGFEVIVVDNGSTDTTLQILKRYCKLDSRITVYSSSKGRSNARNLGLTKAKGNFIQFLDDDDEIAPNKLYRAISFLEHNLEYDAFVCGSVTINDKSGEIVRRVKTNIVYKNGLLGYNPFRINDIVFRRRIVKYEFNQSLEFCEDWLFWAMNLETKKIYIDNLHFEAIVHVTGSNTSKNFLEMVYHILYVRALIKKKKKKHTLRLFKRDIRLASIFILLKFPTKKYDEAIKKSFWLQLYILKLLFLLPCVKNFFVEREKKDIDESEY